MSEFHTLPIAAVSQQPNAVIWHFDIPSEWQTDYRHHAGQHLTFNQTINDEQIRRSYSICSSSLQADRLSVLVKHIHDGQFSSWAQQQQAGTKLSVLSPTGRFILKPEEGKRYVGFAAGAGITPIMGMIYATLEQTDTAEFILFYGNKTAKDVLLQQQIAALKDRYGQRLSVHYFLTQQAVDVPFNQGRFDSDKVTQIYRQILKPLSIDGYYVCGPGLMIDDLCACLESLGIEKSAIHNERFLSEGQAIKTDRKPAQKDADVKVTMDGIEHQFNLKAGSDKTLLETAEDAGIALPYSCRAGVCATCRCRLLDGEVEMINNYSLEDWETKAGYILGCQSLPRSKKIHISFDE
jgi:Flavodoxin reductases (ferredoxin-NADPH reductases) family 1